MEAILIEVNKLQKSLAINSLLREIFADRDFQLGLLDIIRYEQLYKEGVSEENIIIGYYHPDTKELKEAKGVISTHITLRDTEAFYESMRVIINSNNIVIDADGIKNDPITGETTDLFKKYGDVGNLLGLTPQHWDEMIDELTPAIIEQLWKYIEA